MTWTTDMLFGVLLASADWTQWFQQCMLYGKNKRQLPLLDCTARNTRKTGAILIWPDVNPTGTRKPFIFNVTVLAGVLACLASGPLLAQSDTPSWSFNGYGTLGVAYSSESRADYIPNTPLRSEGPGRSGSWNAGVDTRAALQVDYRASSRLTATVQLITEQDFGKSYSPRLEWANLRYEHSPALSVRLGRISLGTFMVSDYRKVGYALPWVRPPAELYHLVWVTNSDGVDVTYRFNLDDETHHSIQLVYGRNKVSERRGDIEIPNFWAVYNRLQRGSFSLHASYQQAKLNIGLFDDLWAAYRSFGPAGEAVVARYDTSRNWTPLLALGLEYDPGDWFVMTEWGRGDSRTDFGARNGWYVSGGYRVGDWTPYLTFAKSQGGNRQTDGLDASSFPPSSHDVIAFINNNLNLAQAVATPRQHTVSIGARWDVLPQTSIKAQYDRVSVGTDAIGTFRNLVSPDYRPSGADVFSMTVDFLF